MIRGSLIFLAGVILGWALHTGTGRPKRWGQWRCPHYGGPNDWNHDTERKFLL